MKKPHCYLYEHHCLLFKNNDLKEPTQNASALEVINLLEKATTVYDNDDEMTDGVIDDIPSCHSCVTNERFEMKDKKKE